MPQIRGYTHIWGYTSHMGYTLTDAGIPTQMEAHPSTDTAPLYYEGIPTHMEAHPSTGHPLIVRVYPPTRRHTRIRGYTHIWDIPLLWVHVPTCGYTPHVRRTVPYGIYHHKEGTLSNGVSIPIRVWTYSTLLFRSSSAQSACRPLGMVGGPPPECAEAGMSFGYRPWTPWPKFPTPWRAIWNRMQKCEGLQP